jgi:cellulose synthase/poly-beta-1,6-N-acetylglucosamine synthase-like glycosyltransferase
MSKTEFDEIDENLFGGKIIKTVSASEKPLRTYKAIILKQETKLPIKNQPEKTVRQITPETELPKPEKPKEKTPIKCDFCKDDIFEEEKTISAKNKIYHEICFEFVLDKIKPEKQKISKDGKPQYGRVDPVLILLMGGIFGMLILTAYLMLSVLSAIAITIGMALSFYHIIDAGRSFSKKNKPRQLPSYFVFVTLIMPIIFGAIIAIDGYEIWYSAPKAIIVWGLALTFWSNMVFVPLSIYSKYKESAPYDNTFRPFVSVIVPAYNEEKVIGRTIESVLAVDYPRMEVIVVNDGSTDKTLQIINTYKPKIKVVDKPNGGKYTALNYGLLYSKGEIIVTIDADTILAPQSITSIVESFKNKNVGAVAGNIKVRNRTNWITWCQALEYVAGIQIFRRTLDFFNSVAIVPGALGAFRKSFLQKVGNFTCDTLAEDFDATLKILKSGLVVAGRINSRAYTESPDSLAQFIRQRKRWYRGDMQVLSKHRNAFMNSKFGTLYKLTFPLMIISMFVTPFAGIIVWTFAVIDILGGGAMFVVQMMIIFIILQHLQAALAVRIEGEDPRLILYSTFFVVGYKQIIDVLLMKSAIETLLGRKAVWTTVKRQGLNPQKK